MILTPRIWCSVASLFGGCEETTTLAPTTTTTTTTTTTSGVAGPVFSTVATVEIRQNCRFSLKL